MGERERESEMVVVVVAATVSFAYRGCNIGFILSLTDRHWKGGVDITLLKTRFHPENKVSRNSLPKHLFTIAV